MRDWIQGENGNLYKNIWRKISKRVGAQISGCSRNHFARENGVCEISQTLKKGYEITSQQKSYSRKAAKLASTLMFSASSLRHISGNFRRKSTTLYKKAVKFSQQKGDFAALCKILPLAWSDLLAMAVTPSFQLRIVHRLKHWIVDFMSFEMVYRM